MKTIKTRRVKAISLLTAAGAAAILFAGVKTLNAGADEAQQPQAYIIADVTNEETGSLKMASGASIRNSGNEKAENGLRYALTLSEAHYNGLKQSVENGTYNAIAFGVLLLPKSYNDIYAARDYTFGENAVYNWAVKNESGEWEYTAEDGKTRIFNLVGDAMRYNESLNSMAFYGTITDVLEENMGREMLGIGYISYEKDGVTNYAFTPQKDESDNVRTMAYVAQKAIEAGAENAGWLEETYIKPVREAGTQYSYNTEYYFGDENGVYETAPSRVVSATAKLGESVTAAELDLTKLKGYVYDDVKSASECSGKMEYALSGELTVKRYYKRVTQLIETNAVSQLNMLSLTDEDLSGKTVTATLRAANGRVAECENPESVATADIPQGLYKLELKADGKIAYTGNLDFYNEDDGMVWQDLSEYSVNDSEVLCGGYMRLADTKFSAIDGEKALSFDMVIGEGNTTNVGMRVRAIHSKAYYEMMSETYSAVKFSVYLSGGGLNVMVCDVSGDKDNWLGKNTWREYAVSIGYLLENWDTINGIGELGKGDTKTCQLFSTKYGTVGTHVVSVGRFGCVEKTEAIDVSGVQLVETAETPEYNLLSLDAENKLDKSLTYKAVLVAQSGRAVRCDNAAKIDTANIPQGVYTAKVMFRGATYLTATIDIYTAADGLVWNIIDEDILENSQVWKNSYINVGDAEVVDGRLKIVSKLCGEGNSNGIGLRMRAVHSKNYYEMMSDNYEAITFDVEIQSEYESKVFWFGNSDGKYLEKAQTVSVSIALADLLSNWDNMNNLTQKNISAMLVNFTTYKQADDTHTFFIGNFGCVKKAAEEA